MNNQDYDQDYERDWLTFKERLDASIMALDISDEFMTNKFLNGEEIWQEIFVNGKAFDLNIWEEDFDPDEDERTSPVHVSLYPTIENEDGLRETSTVDFVRLHTIKRGIA